MRVQFLGQSTAVWRDRSLLDNKVLSGRNILWTDWGVASHQGSLSSEPEIPTSPHPPGHGQRARADFVFLLLTTHQ